MDKRSRLMIGIDVDANLLMHSRSGGYSESPLDANWQGSESASLASNDLTMNEVTIFRDAEDLKLAC
jgi:hypothetical protein